MYKIKKVLSLFLLGIMVISSLGINNQVFADRLEDDEIVVLGKNLNEKQRAQMLSEFGVKANEVKIIEITNEEERQYLGKFVDEKQLGTRAISSAYIKRLPEGKGVSVSSNNISWVTNDMYRNALVTAGVSDAEVKISSPVEVSGTAALTGIMKAYEDMSGKVISELEKEVASEEIAKTAELGSIIGKEEAEKLVGAVKIYIIENGITNTEDIVKAIENISKDMEITLTKEQQKYLMELMEKISNMDLNIDDIKSQIGDIVKGLDKLIKENVEVRNLLQRILDSISNFFSRLFGK